MAATKAARVNRSRRRRTAVATTAAAAAHAPSIHSEPAVGAAPQSYSSSIPSVLRQRFEQRLGGAVGVQETTDRVLDASASLVARVHALEVLAGKFPPPTEAGFSSEDRLVLRRLRRHHLAELHKLVGQIRASLDSLLENADSARAHAAEGRSEPTWQTGIPSPAVSARDLDRLLNRLLAGSYSQTSGEEMLRETGPAIERVDSSVQSQANWE